MTSLGFGLIACGVFFFFTGAIGLIRFPDLYTRMHAAGKCDTLGGFLVLTGLACLGGLTLASLKIVMVALFVLITSPTATHAIARAAKRNDIAWWTRGDQR